MTRVSVRWAEATAPVVTASVLGEGETGRWRAFRRDRDREMFLAAHVLARGVVSEHCGVMVGEVDLVQRCPRCGGPHGRPTAVVGGEAGPCVSFAHAGGFVIAAVADRPVGVDLESVSQERLDVAAVALSPDERAQLDTAAPAERASTLIRWWVRKEAVLKATGDGLRRDPQELQVTPPWEPAAVVGRSPVARLLDLGLEPELAATVALLGAQPFDVELSRWQW